MDFKKVTVYFIPGMAAGPEIFDNIRLPKDKYQIEILEWMIPNRGETLKEYAERMAKRVTAPNPVLVGISFGGIVAQEMTQFVKLRKLIIISSVKKRSELPKRMRVSGALKLYKLVPTGLVLSVENLTKYSIGPKSKKRLSLYQKYLHVRNRYYLDWCIKQIVTWEREECVPELIHIQGDNDPVFPIKYIEKCEVIKDGTHIMILNRAGEITRLLLEKIED